MVINGNTLEQNVKAIWQTSKLFANDRIWKEEKEKFQKLVHERWERLDRFNLQRRNEND